MKKTIILFFLILLSCDTQSHKPVGRFFGRRENMSNDFRKPQYSHSYGHSYSDKKYNSIKPDAKPYNSGKYEGYYKVGNPYQINGITYYPREEPDYEEVGVASWYGEDFHNKKTANGETYNMHDMTAAHRTLPMPSVVEVTNLENGRKVLVRVNDRGPFAKERIIDVSKTVAAILGFREQGTTRVKVKFMEKETEEMLKSFGLKK